MAGPRRRLHRLVLVLVAVVVVLPLVATTAIAASRAAAKSPSVRAQQPLHTTARPERAQRRGDVKVSRLPAATASPPSKPEAASPTLAPAAPSSALVVTPVDLATTSGTTAPTLTKLPVGTAHANDPNPVVAVGPDHVARSDDGLLTVTNRSGGAASTVSFADLFLLPDGTENSEGQIYYDEAHGRWVAVEASRDCHPGDGAIYGHGYLDFAVSDNANPNLGWSVYTYQYNDQLTWDPGYGSSADKIALISRFEDMGPGCTSVGAWSWDVTGITWPDLVKGTFNESYLVFEPNDEDLVMDLAPVVRQGGGNATLEVIMDLALNPSGAEQWLLRTTGSGPAATSTLSLLPVPLFGYPQSISQGGPTFNPPGGVSNAVAVDDRLVFSLTEPCTPAGDSMTRNCARIVELETNGDLGRVQDFYIAKNGLDTFSPSVGIAGTGDLIITYQQASDAAGPTSYVVRQAKGDAAHSVSATRTLITPTALYQNLNGAQMVGTQQDPLVPDAMWVINQAGGTVDPTYSYRLQVAQARTATGDTYKPIEPLRVLDTRDGTGGLSGPFQNGVPRTFAVAGAGGGKIPANAVAITANVTVAGQSSAGFVSVGPSIGANPSTSTINFPLGDARANNLTLPLNSQGKLMAVFRGSAGKSTHLIVDVTGYFVADDTGATYKPVTATRLLDTRDGTGGLSGAFKTGTPRTFQVTGGIIPAGAKAVTGNLTVVGQTTGGYISLTPTATADPKTSTLNFPVGDVRANGVTVPLSATGTLSAVYKSSIPGSTHLAFDVTGYYLAGTSGLRFYPLNPGRIMDTRSTSLTQLAGMFTTSVPRTLVTGGHFGVPNDALAVTGNLTVASQTYSGYVSITKDPVANPTVSSINFPLGDIRANGVTVPLNAANDMALVYKSSKAGAKTHLILDLTGYFR